MALVACKSCGKEISDKAKACPACGAILIEDIVEKKLPVICQECGFEIPDGAESCPNCGCPVELDDSVDGEADQPQKVELTSVKLPKMKQNTMKKAIMAVAALALIIAVAIIGINAHNNNKAKEAAEAYENNLALASMAMITGGAEAEEAGNLIKAVWHNSIYEERDTKTDKYTRPNGYFEKDFNTALSNLFSDSDFISTISSIESNQDFVAGYMKDLKNPPEGYEEAYSAVKDCYDTYLSFTNLVTSPSGSLQTFSSNFNDLDSDFVTKYNALQLYLE